MTPDASSKKEILFGLVVVSFGLLCVLQAVNISLHLAFYSSCANTADLEAVIKNLTEEGADLKRKLSTFERRLCHLLFLGFGVLFIIQAILNISLRLTLYSSKDSTYSNCNATDFRNQNQMKEEENYCEKKKSGEHNRCQDRINALTRDISLLENRNTELANKIKNVEEERDRLKSELKELRGCSSSQQCPAGWRLINCRCYFVSTERRTWKDSREYCQSKDADLVVINSEEEQTSLYRLNGNVPAYWIGLHVPTGSTGWKWVDGSALTKSFWTPGQPNRNPMKVEDCVTMYLFYPELANWHDIPCSTKQRWLCEKDQCSCL